MLTLTLVAFTVGSFRNMMYRMRFTVMNIKLNMKMIAAIQTCRVVPLAYTILKVPDGMSPENLSRYSSNVFVCEI